MTLAAHAENPEPAQAHLVDASPMVERTSRHTLGWRWGRKVEGRLAEPFWADFFLFKSFSSARFKYDP